MAKAAAINNMEQLEQLKQLLMQMNQIQGVQTINMVQDSFKVMDSQHEVLYQELQDVKKQLNEMQASLNNLGRHPTASRREKAFDINVKEHVTNLENKVSGIGNYITQMKKSIGEKAAGVMKNFKAQGIIALSNITNKLGVKNMFQAAEKHFSNEAKEMQKSITKLDTISREVNEAKTHTRNIGRAIAGKELKDVPEKQGALFKILKAPYRKVMEFCQDKSAKAHDMVVHIEKLEVKALDAKDQLQKKNKESAPKEAEAEKKPSVLEQLNKNKEKIENKNQPKEQEQQQNTIQEESFEGDHFEYLMNVLGEQEIQQEDKPNISKESREHAASETKEAAKKPSVLEQLNKNKEKIESMNQQGQEKQKGTVQHEDRQSER